MSVHVGPCIYMAVHGYTWISMDINGCMGIHGYPFVFFSSSLYFRPFGLSSLIWACPKSWTWRAQYFNFLLRKLTRLENHLQMHWDTHWLVHSLRIDSMQLCKIPTLPCIYVICLQAHPWTRVKKQNVKGLGGRGDALSRHHKNELPYSNHSL